MILVNKGDIEANYAIQPSSSLFGPKFSFNPSSGHLFPDGLQAIQVMNKVIWIYITYSMKFSINDWLEDVWYGIYTVWTDEYKNS